MSLYDPQFYEYQGLLYICRKYQTPIQTNFKAPIYSLPLSKRPEVDGLITKGFCSTMIEVKSFLVNENLVTNILDKASHLSYSKTIIVCPKHNLNSQEVKSFKNKGVEIEVFGPKIPLQLIKEFYKDLRKINFSTHITQELQTGKHNFRYRLVKRAKNKRFRYINQTDKKISNLQNLSAEITKRIPSNNPPLKILWSTKRWLSPKDLFFHKRDHLNLGGPLVFDIDGQKVHNPYFPCEIDPQTGLCHHCLFFSKKESKKLLGILKKLGYEKIKIFFSGRTGFHIYVFDQNNHKLKNLILEIQKKKIHIDPTVTFNQKSMIALPNSLNGITGYKLTQVNNLDSFKPRHEL